MVAPVIYLGFPEHSLSAGQYVIADLTNCPYFGSLGTPHLACCDGTSLQCDEFTTADRLRCGDADQWVYCCTYPVDNYNSVPGGASWCKPKPGLEKAPVQDCNYLHYF